VLLTQSLDQKQAGLLHLSDEKCGLNSLVSEQPSTAPQRYRLTIAYDGTRFHGWQKQCPPGRQPLRTVGGVIESRLQMLLRQPINLVGASRTDSGVHARGQVAHFDASNVIPMERLVKAINSKLPDDVEVMDAQVVPDDFDAISGATRKQYRYRLYCSEHRPLALRHVVFPCWVPLDIDAMRDAARRIEGTHDFEGFANAGHGRDSTVRTVYKCAVERDPPMEPEVHIVVEGDGFLYNMVRIIAGTLYEVGRGRMPAEQVDEILATANRRLAGPTMPPQGLWLEWIEYAGDRGQETGDREGNNTIPSQPHGETSI